MNDPEEVEIEVEEIAPEELHEEIAPEEIGVEEVQGAEGAVKPKRKRKAKDTTPKEKKPKGPKAPKKPTFKNWIAAIKSMGNSLDNVTVKVVVNSATNVLELRTNAPASEGSAELEGERIQIIKFTEFEVINDPARVYDEPVPAKATPATQETTAQEEPQTESAES